MQEYALPDPKEIVKRIAAKAAIKNWENLPYKRATYKAMEQAAIEMRERTLEYCRKQQDGTIRFIPMQLCPKCNGHCKVSVPFEMNGDAQRFTSTETSHSCWVCEGKGVIPMQQIES